MVAGVLNTGEGEMQAAARYGMMRPAMPGSQHVIFLNGPIGVGKTTLGRALAVRLDGAFIDSDDLGDPEKRWFEQILTTSRALVRAVCAALDDSPVVVIAKPLRARDWGYFRGQFAARGIATSCVTLTADFATIVDPVRGRQFDEREQRRIAVMIAEGYGSRPFSDLMVGTGTADFAASLAALETGCRGLLGRPL
jgi:AAA domain